MNKVRAFFGGEGPQSQATNTLWVSNLNGHSIARDSDLMSATVAGVLQATSEEIII